MGPKDMKGLPKSESDKEEASESYDDEACELAGQTVLDAIKARDAMAVGQAIQAAMRALKSPGKDSKK